MTLHARAWLALAVVTVVMTRLLFGGAGTTWYWQAWVYVASNAIESGRGFAPRLSPTQIEPKTIFARASALTTAHLLKHDPALLERRMRGGPMFEQR